MHHLIVHVTDSAPKKEKKKEKRNCCKQRGSGREIMVSEVPRWQEVSAFWLSAREKYRKRDETGVKFEAGRGRKTLQGTKAGLQNRKRQNS